MFRGRIIDGSSSQAGLESSSAERASALAGCLDDGPSTINIGSSAGLGFEIVFPNEAPVSVFQCVLP